MTTVVKVSVSQALAQALIDDIFQQKNRYYFGVGRCYPWPDDNEVPDSIDTEKYEISARNDMLLFKAIDGNNLSFIIDRIDYEPNTIYAKYDDDMNQEGQNYYVLTSDYNVYKCLYNNEGTESTVEPFGTALEPITYSDGYVWKYIYSLPPALRTKFLTPSSMPIYNSITSEYYSRGSLHNFQITNAGDGYTQSSTSITVIGDGYLEDNPIKVTEVQLVDGGSGYENAPDVELEDPVSNTQNWVAETDYIVGQNIRVDDGNIRFYRVVTPGTSGLTEPSHYYSEANNGTLGLKHVGTKPMLEATVNDDAVGSVLIIEPGFGYTSAPTVTKSGAGSGATFQSVLDGSSIASVTVLTPGDGYVNTDMTIASPFPSATTYNTTTAYSINTILKVDDLFYKCTNGGTSGASAPTHESGTVLNGTILLQFVGKQAEIAAVLGVVDSISYYGDIEKVNVSNGGSGYDENTTTVEFTGGSPITPATANAVVVGGKVTAINVTFPGIGYESVPTVVIDGDGTGASASAVLQFGYGYGDVPEVVFADPDNDNGVFPLTNVPTQKTEAILEPVIIDGKLRGIKIIDGGVGYTVVNMTVIGDGEEAEVRALFTSGDLVTPQTRNELFAVPGQLSSITIEEPGEGIYSINTTITGDGTGAQIEPVIFGGQLQQLKVIDGGTGYTNIDIEFTINDGAEAPTVRPIISPIKGHGSNPIKELRAKSVAIYTKLSDETNNNIVSENEYRQVSIIKNPLKYNQDAIASEKTLSSCIVVSTPSDLSQIVANTELEDGDEAVYKVVHKTGQTLLLQPTQNSTISPNDVLSATINNIEYNVIVTSITPPQIDKYSGDILFIDNLTPFKPTSDQAIAISTTIDLN